MALQSFNEIVISWNKGLSDKPCPIINYTININGSTVTVDGNNSQYTHSIGDECVFNFEISMFATSAAGPGEITATNLSIVPEGEYYSVKCLWLESIFLFMHYGTN